MRTLFLLSASLLLAGPGHASAQTSPPCSCPPRKLVPIAGHVLDAVTGKPIAGAVVHYFDTREPRPPGEVGGPPSGEVRTAVDGSYALPADLPGDSFHVRAAAPGYLGAAFYDHALGVGETWPADFPAPPSHDLRLQPSHDLLAIGGSRFAGALPHAGFASVSAAAFAPGRQALVLALPGPTLWQVALPAGQPQPIALPAEITPRMSLSSLGYDGDRLLFVAGESGQSFFGEASAPDFHVQLLPLPSDPYVILSPYPPLADPPRFTVQQTSSCDDEAPDPTPHCGQSGSLVVHDRQTNRTRTIRSDSPVDLDYLLHPYNDGTLVFPDPREVRITEHVPVQIERSGRIVRTEKIAGLTMLELTTGRRSHIELPGDGSRTLHLLAPESLGADGRLVGMRVAYTVTGDCDPASTDAAQPFAPDGPAGVTPNQWSLCLVTIPMPAVPPPTPARKVAAQQHPHPRAH